MLDIARDANHFTPQDSLVRFPVTDLVQSRIGITGYGLLGEVAGDQLLQVVEGSLAKVVCAQHLQLAKQLHLRFTPHQ